MAAMVATAVVMVTAVVTAAAMEDVAGAVEEVEINPLKINYMQSKNELWQRIATYHPDQTGLELPFSKRLAIENGWSRRYALRVIEEYKRFAFLALEAGHPVTPSEAVDQAWHLHLVYTHSYWEDFCGKVLQRPLHHSPTTGGNQEAAKYLDQYEKTLQAYRAFFAEEPLADIWPSPTERFAAGLWRWVSLKAYWVIKKPVFWVKN